MSKDIRFRGYTLNNRDACALLLRGTRWVVTEYGQDVREFTERAAADELYELTRAAVMAASTPGTGFDIARQPHSDNTERTAGISRPGEAAIRRRRAGYLNEFGDYSKGFRS